MKTRILGTCLLTTCFLSSCAADRTAADLAGRTIVEITAYEQQVDNKINAERGFYRQQAATLSRLEGYVPLPKVPAEKKVDTKAAEETMGAADAVQEQQKLVRNSLAYLRITRASNRDAIHVVDSLLGSDTPAARSALMDYLHEGIAEDTESIEKSVAARQKMEVELIASLAKLDAGKQNLKKAREALVELKEKKSTLDQIKNILRVGKEARKIVKESEGDDKAATTSTP